MTELDERKSAILRAIVEQYVDSAQPVGSQTVSDRSDLGVSPATVRNEMGTLEREGYITHPHTSAGRIPTDRGYRYYVDHLAGAATLPSAERRRVADFFASTARAMDELLAETSQLLAGITTQTAVVMGPQPEGIEVRSASLVQLQPQLLLAVVVLSDGSVQKEVVALESEADDELVETASRRLAGLLANRRLGDFSTAEPAPGHRPDAADALVGQACAALERHVRHHHGEPLYVGGAAHLASEYLAFPSVASATRLLELLEQHTVLATVMRELLGPGLTVSIGSENERDDLRACSLVLAPFVVEGEAAGTVGVLGPTRMDYRKARAAVIAVSRQLGRQLSQ